MSPLSATPVAVSFSGGVDCAVLIGRYVAEGRRVQPIYVRSGLAWQESELEAARAYLDATRSPLVNELVILDMPLADLYGEHWSITGSAVPDSDSSDEAVFLPGRNPLLLLKSRFWCAEHGITELAVGVLASNPFADATDEFFESFAELLDDATGNRVRFTRPLARLDKATVVRQGADLPLELTFSCLAPIRDAQGKSIHCGHCNKCAERMSAFALAGRDDGAQYALEPHTSLHAHSP